jgi:serine protease Do
MVAAVVAGVVLVRPDVLLNDVGDAPRTAALEQRPGEPAAASAADAPGGPQDVERSSSARYTPVVSASRRVTPSVVSVNVIRRQRVGPRSLWEEWFVPFGYEREVAGLGSGFAIARGGYVLTNAHVVEGATEIVVSTVDGADLPAQLVGSDALSDLALLKVEAELPVPRFGDSDDLMIGEPAIAIGNPFGYLLSNVEPTVTTGVISGTGRHILPGAISSSDQEGQTIYADMVQTDASINPGNSGGPLVNADAEVIGVNSAIFSRSGGSQGLGFAIPINRALRISEQLRSDGQVRRPWVGIDVGPMESDRAGRRRGAAIVRVAEGSPAQRANIEPGLEVIAVQDRTVKSPLDWEAELFNVQPGQRLDVTLRDSQGREQRVTLTVEDLPSVQADRIEVLEGLVLITLTPAIQAERALRSRQGALISDVSSEVASVTGLRRGDLIVAVNRQRVADADDVADLLDYLTGRGAIRLYYERDGVIWSTTFRIVED